MEFGEIVAVDPSKGHESSRCPFCPLEKEKKSKTSYICKDNNSSTLESNLTAAGDPKTDHLYFDVEFGLYRRYSAEAHHVICGNEVLAEEGELERYLIQQSKQSTKKKSGFLEPNDVGYDVNNAKNGIWLPSVPDMFRVANGRDPDRWWGDQKTWNRKNPQKPRRTSMEEWEKMDAAFIVMDAVKRQFHKGPHGKVVKPHQNYVKMAIKRLQQVTVFVKHYSKICPMEEDGSPRTAPPYWPATGLISILDALSANLHRELEGPPETWNFYISVYALQCSLHWKKNLGLS